MAFHSCGILCMFPPNLTYTNKPSMATQLTVKHITRWHLPHQKVASEWELSAFPYRRVTHHRPTLEEGRHRSRTWGPYEGSWESACSLAAHSQNCLTILQSHTLNVSVRRKWKANVKCSYCKFVGLENRDNFFVYYFKLYLKEALLYMWYIYSNRSVLFGTVNFPKEAILAALLVLNTSEIYNRLWTF